MNLALLAELVGNTLFAASLEGTALFWRAPSWEEIEAGEKKENPQ